MPASNGDRCDEIIPFSKKSMRWSDGAQRSAWCQRSNECGINKAVHTTVVVPSFRLSKMDFCPSKNKRRRGLFSLRGLSETLAVRFCFFLDTFSCAKRGNRSHCGHLDGRGVFDFLMFLVAVAARRLEDETVIVSIWGYDGDGDGAGGEQWYNDKYVLVLGVIKLSSVFGADNVTGLEL